MKPKQTKLIEVKIERTSTHPNKDDHTMGRNSQNPLRLRDSNL